MFKDMKMLMNNFITVKVFKDENKRNLGFCKHNISYASDMTKDDVPEQLQILKGNTWYIYNYSGKV